MGLDSVELLMEFEEAFAIAISDEEAEKMVSVKAATDTIAGRLLLQPSAACNSQKLFYQFRRYFTRNFDAVASNFKPTANLNKLLPTINRKKLWRKMQVDLNWMLPELPKANVEAEPKLGAKLVGVIWPQSQLAATGYTVRDFVDFTFALNYRRLVILPTPANRYEVEKAIMGLTHYCTGIAIHHINPDSRFVQDLGLD